MPGWWPGQTRTIGGFTPTNFRALGIVASENGRFPRKAVKACCLQISKLFDRLAFVVTAYISTTNVQGKSPYVLRTVRV